MVTLRPTWQGAFGDGASARLPVALLCLIAMGFHADAAQASFTICNRSFDIANVAIGTGGDDAIETRGWWKIGPNQCAEVIDDTLSGSVTYVFALDVFGRELLLGAVPLCVAPDRFTITDAGRDCTIRGYLEARYLAVETGDARAWRMFIAPAPQ